VGPCYNYIPVGPELPEDIRDGSRGIREWTISVWQTGVMEPANKYYSTSSWTANTNDSTEFTFKIYKLLQKYNNLC